MTYPSENVIKKAIDGRNASRDARVVELSRLEDKYLFMTAMNEGLDPKECSNRVDLIAEIVNKLYPDLFEDYTYHYENTQQDATPPSEPNNQATGYVTAEAPADATLYRDLVSMDKIPAIENSGLNPAHPDVAHEPLVYVGYRDWMNGAIVKLDMTEIAWTSGFSGGGGQAPVALVAIPSWFIHDDATKSLIASVMAAALSDEPVRVIDTLNAFCNTRNWDAHELWAATYGQPVAGSAPDPIEEPTQLNPIVDQER